jgi:hypothetical protein
LKVLGRGLGVTLLVSLGGLLDVGLGWVLSQAVVLASG